MSSTQIAFSAPAVLQLLRIPSFPTICTSKAPRSSRKHQRYCRNVKICATASAPPTEDLEQEIDSAQPSTSGRNRSHDTDYVVIGSGIGGELNNRCLGTWHARHRHLASRQAGSLAHVVKHYMTAGLCCAALLAKYGFRVTVCESHYHAGGAAHGFEVQVSTPPPWMLQAMWIVKGKSAPDEQRRRQEEGFCNALCIYAGPWVSL